MARLYSFALFCVLSLGTVAWGQSQVIWDFTTAGPSSGVPIANLAISNVAQGNNNGTTTLLSTSSASSGYAGASGTSNAGAAARTGVLNTASGGSAYFEFSLTPNTGYVVVLSGISFGSRSTSTGPQAYSLRYSIDGYASDLATGTLTNNSTWSLKSNSGLSVSSTGGTAVTYRLYGHNGTGSPTASTANWRIDDLTLTLNVIPDPDLPVEMTSFTAQAHGTSVLLKWATATEVNNHGFDVEKNVDGEWTKIAFIEGNGTSNAAHEYSYVDAKAAGNVSYRLKQIDNDGAFNYSEIASVEVAAPKAFELLNNYPNPFNPATEIRFAVPENGQATLIVYNALGQQVATLYNGMAQAGQYVTATFNASHLASGVYIARLQYAGKSLMQKMMLAK